MGRWYEGEEKLLIMDNCGPYKVRAVLELMEESKMAVQFLPPNVTVELQVTDLVVNSVAKHGIRRENANADVASFGAWRKAANKDIPAGKPMLPFMTGKRTVHDGERALLECCRTQFSKESFMTSLMKSFVSIGLVPVPGSTPCRYEQYTDKKSKLL